MDVMTKIGSGPGGFARRLPDVAFALTGLGGSNSFGAGFLQAALDYGVRPRIISCTSGMIHWTWRYLEALRADDDERPGLLRREVEAMIARTEPFPKSVDVLNACMMTTMGLPDVFRWARPEFFARFFTTPLCSVDAVFPGVWADLFMPAQMMVPIRGPEIFEAMAEAFTREKEQIGVCFNSFLPETGTEFLHANGPARRMLDAERDRMKAGRVLDDDVTAGARPRRRSLPRKAIADVTPQDIEDALWLTLYGAHSNVGRGGYANRLDGAYLRSVILSELTMVDAILMPRPVATQRTDFPSNYFEVEDFKTEMWWNASCGPQVAAIEFVNRLVRAGRLKGAAEGGGSDFRVVRVVPIEIDVDRGFFSYFREDLATFDRGYNEACAAFDRLWKTGVTEAEDEFSAAA